MPRDEVDDAGLLSTLALAVEQEAVDARLEPVFIVRDGVEADVEEPLAEPVADGSGNQVSQDALTVVRMTEAPEGSHLASQEEPRQRGPGPIGGEIDRGRRPGRALLLLLLLPSLGNLAPARLTRIWRLRTWSPDCCGASEAQSQPYRVTHAEAGGDAVT